MAYYGKKEPIPIPQKSEAGRPVTVGGKYIYWVTQSYRDPDGKVKDDRKAIGRIVDSDPSMMWPNGTNYYLIFGSDDQNGDNRNHGSQLSVGQYIAIARAADQMGVMEALITAFPKEWPKIFALCVQWIDMEDNVSQCFEYWFYDHYCGFFTPMDPSNISRLYEAIGLSLYQRNLYRRTFNELYRKRFSGIKSKNQDKQKKRVVGVDGTNNNHQCDLNELLGYGKAKEDSSKPIYGTMTYVDELTGLTLFAQLYPGSLPDKTEIISSLERSLDLGFRDLHMMFDRGFLSAKFLAFFFEVKQQYNITFSASCPGTFSFVQEMTSKYSKELCSKAQYYIAKENVYGMKIPDSIDIEGEGITKDDLKTLSIYLFYDDVRAATEKQAINDKVNAFQAMFEQRKKYTDKLVQDAKKYFRVIKTKKDPETGRSFKLERKHDVIQKELDNTGYFMSISNGTQSAEEEIIIIRMRDKNEKSYRRRKSFFGLDTPGTETYETFLGKMFVADVAQNVEEAFEYACKPFIRAKSSRTVRTTVAELGKYKLVFNDDGKMKPEHNLTAEQKQILKCLGLAEHDVDSYVRSLEWGKIPPMIHNSAEMKKIEKAKRDAERKAANDSPKKTKNKPKKAQ